MTFPRPSLQELRQRAASDVATSLGRGPTLEGSILFQLSQTVAGASHSQYGYLDWIYAQTFPDTAATEGLDRWGRLYGVPRRTAAFAVGTAVFTGPEGVTVPQGVRLIREDGAVFETTADGVVAGGSLEVAVRATEAGAEGNTLSGVELRLAAGLEGFQPLVPVGQGGIGGGADVEDDAELRARITARLRSPGQGGNAADYIRWALEVPGATRA